MLRFVIRSKFYHATNGLSGEGLYTMDLLCPELEQALTRGGTGECGYEYHELVGVEIMEKAE